AAARFTRCIRRGSSQDDITGEQIDCSAVDGSRSQMAAAAEEVPGDSAVDHHRAAPGSISGGQGCRCGDVRIRESEMNQTAVRAGTRAISRDETGVQEIAGLDN